MLYNEGVLNKSRISWNVSIVLTHLEQMKVELILTVMSLYLFAGSPGRSQARSSVNWTTTLGLVVHAAADGIAMGAAAATHQV